MKEIDFLPDWYKNGRKRKRSHHTQYIVLCCLFLAMITYSFIGGRAIKKARADLKDTQVLYANQQAGLREFAALKMQCEKLKTRTDILKQIESKISIADVIAEMSALVNNGVVFKGVDIVSENFSEGQTAAVRGSVVRTAMSASKNLQDSLKADYRFKVVLTGVAAGASNVATLIQKLEGSQYFCQVIPGFSRNSVIDERQLTEFEISCYVANYKLEK